MQSLRSCLFSRKVFYTDGGEAGTVRVEFIPNVYEERQVYRNERHTVHPSKRRRLNVTQEIHEVKESQEETGSSGSCSTTIEDGIM